MFKKLIPILPQIIASLFLAGAVVLAAPWQGPTNVPPLANADAPINTGTSTQYKKGGFGIGGLFETDTDVHLGILSGKVGIGTTTPSEILEILGNIKIGSQGQIKNMRVENFAGLPALGNQGRMIYNTSDAKLYFDTGAVWKALNGPSCSSVELMGPLPLTKWDDTLEKTVGIPINVPSEAYQVICKADVHVFGFGYSISVKYNGVEKIYVNPINPPGNNLSGAAVWSAGGGGQITWESNNINNYLPGNCWYTKLNCAVPNVQLAGPFPLQYDSDIGWLTVAIPPEAKDVICAPPVVMSGQGSVLYNGVTTMTVNSAPASANGWKGGIAAWNADGGGTVSLTGNFLTFGGSGACYYTKLQ